LFVYLFFTPPITAVCCFFCSSQLLCFPGIRIRFPCVLFQLRSKGLFMLEILQDGHPEVGSPLSMAVARRAVVLVRFHKAVVVVHIAGAVGHIAGAVEHIAVVDMQVVGTVIANIEIEHIEVERTGVGHIEVEDAAASRVQVEEVEAFAAFAAFACVFVVQTCGLVQVAAAKAARCYDGPGNPLRCSLVGGSANILYCSQSSTADA